MFQPPDGTQPLVVLNALSLVLLAQAVGLVACE